MLLMASSKACKSPSSSISVVAHWTRRCCYSYEDRGTLWWVVTWDAASIPNDGRLTDDSRLWSLPLPFYHSQSVNPDGNTHAAPVSAAPPTIELCSDAFQPLSVRGHHWPVQPFATTPHRSECV
jgi:hypothetical protein